MKQLIFDQLSVLQASLDKHSTLIRAAEGIRGARGKYSLGGP